MSKGIITSVYKVFKGTGKPIRTLNPELNKASSSHHFHQLLCSILGITVNRLNND